MTGAYVMDAATFDALIKALFWISFLGGMAGSVLLSLVRDFCRWIERRIDRRRGYDDFADSVESVVRKMDRAHG